MKRRHFASIALASTLALIVSVSLAAQDRFTVKSPNGIAFSEFRGYDTWQVIAPSQTDDDKGCAKAPCLKSIVGNAVMMKAYADGIPANGKPVPDGAVIAKIEWTKSSNTASPYPVTVPGVLNDISFMVKDSKRFPETNGWGYAQFRLNNTSGVFTPWGASPGFAKNDCHQCHINGAKARDYVYTAYAKR